MISRGLLKAACLSAPSVASAYSLVHSYDYTNWYSSFTFETVSCPSSSADAISCSTGCRSNKWLRRVHISERCSVCGDDKHNQQPGVPWGGQHHCSALLNLRLYWATEYLAREPGLFSSWSPHWRLCPHAGKRLWFMACIVC
jgi:hypothetical protein